MAKTDGLHGSEHGSNIMPLFSRLYILISSARLCMYLPPFQSSTHPSKQGDVNHSKSTRLGRYARTTAGMFLSHPVIRERILPSIKWMSRYESNPIQRNPHQCRDATPSAHLHNRRRILSSKENGNIDTAYV